MNLWQRLTIDWPCALGDWLWIYVVIGTKEFLDQLTLRIVLRAALQISFFVLLLMFFQHVIALDLTFLFYIDVASVPEIAAALFALVATGFAGRTFGVAARATRPLLKSCARAWSRFGSRRRRAANTPRRKAGGGEQSDDEPAAWGVPAYGFV